MKINLLKSIKMAENITGKKVIMDDNQTSLTKQTIDSIIFKEKNFNSDNIIHEVCHYLVAKNEEKDKMNLGLDNDNENDLLVYQREIEAFYLQIEFNRINNIKEDSKTLIVQYRNYALERLKELYPILFDNILIDENNLEILNKEYGKSIKLL